jgi:hypothetical protein
MENEDYCLCGKNVQITEAGTGFSPTGIQYRYAILNIRTHQLNLST